MRVEAASEAADWHVNSTWTDAESPEHRGEAGRGHANRLAERNGEGERERVKERQREWERVGAEARADYLIALFTIFCMTLAVGSGGLFVRLSIGSQRPSNCRQPYGDKGTSSWRAHGQPGQARGVLPAIVVSRLSQSERERLRLPAPCSVYVFVYVFFFCCALSSTHHGVARVQIRQAIRPVHSSMG